MRLTNLVFTVCFVILIDATSTNKTRVARVVHGKIVNNGLYMIQSEENTQTVLTVGGEDFGNFQLAGEPLSSIITTKWMNGDDQKWTVVVWGKKYFHLIPKSRSINALTYKIYMKDFPMPNTWEIIPIGTGKFWQLKKYRGKCLEYKGMNRLVGEEKCVSTNRNQAWHLHMLNI